MTFRSRHAKPHLATFQYPPHFSSSFAIASLYVLASSHLSSLPTAYLLSVVEIRMSGFSCVAVPYLDGETDQLEKSAKSATTAFGSDYTAVSRNPSHRWTAEHRMTLCILVQDYEIDWHATKSIFNGLFSSQLPTSQGLSRGALISMYYQLRKDSFDSSGQWVSMRADIEAKAFELGIHLRQKESAAAQPKKSSKRRKTPDENARKLSFEPKGLNIDRLMLDDMDFANDSESTLLGDDYDVLSTPIKRNDRLSAKRSLEIPGLITPPSFKKSKGQDAATSSILPRLGFRA